jgi:hypothetical protein
MAHQMQLRPAPTEPVTLDGLQETTIPTMAFQATPRPRKQLYSRQHRPTTQPWTPTGPARPPGDPSTRFTALRTFTRSLPPPSALPPRSTHTRPTTTHCSTDTGQQRTHQHPITRNCGGDSEGMVRSPLAADQAVPFPNSDTTYLRRATSHAQGDLVIGAPYYT